MSSKSELYYDGTRTNVAEFLPDDYSSVLEIGCGEGGFRSNLKANCEYWGVEPHTLAYETATNRLDKTLNGTFIEVIEEIPNDYFDLVICNDVIEHMIDHDEFFSKIKLKMKNNAYIIGSVPNVRYYPNLLSLVFDKEWEYQDEGILDRTHLRFFTKKSIIRTFHDHGYIIEDLTGINNIIVPKLKSLKKLIKILTIKLIGEDVLSLQFAFRVKLLK